VWDFEGRLTTAMTALEAPPISGRCTFTTRAPSCLPPRRRGRLCRARRSRSTAPRWSTTRSTATSGGSLVVFTPESYRVASRTSGATPTERASASCPAAAAARTCAGSRSSPATCSIR
jgi:hypothetical protein